MLVNGGSRSGKEVLAYGFRKHGIGPVVGSRTAGAVVNFSYFHEADLIENTSMLCRLKQSFFR